MDSYTMAKKIVNTLHEINFTDIIKYKDFNKEKPWEFKFDATQERFDKNAIGYCDSCDRDKAYVNYSENEANNEYKLTNISHGTHSFDFLHAFGLSDNDIETEINNNNWKSEPVLFLMENPSIDYGIYDYITEEKNKGIQGKRPAANWYWIHSGLEENFKNHYYEDDHYLVQQQYGNMVAALIYQNKLANAYLTNLVKCGMTDARLDNGKLVESGYKNLDEYSNECKCNCIKTILSKEIKALCGGEEKLNPLRIFAFGDRPFRIINDFLLTCGTELKLEYQLYQLPHPASREKNSYRKYILKGVLNDSLNDNIFKHSGTINDFMKKDKVEQIFNEEFKDMKLGKKTTKNTYSLNMNTISSIFREGEFVTEVWIKGITNMNWGIGYIFELNEYWYWDYNKWEAISEEQMISENKEVVECFEKAINRILQ